MHLSHPNLALPNLAATAVLALVAIYSIFATIRTHLPWAGWRIGAMLVCRFVLLVAAAAWCMEMRVEYQTTGPGAEMVVIADRSPSISPQGQGAIDDWIGRSRSAFPDSKHGWLKIVEMGDAAHGSTALAEALDSARTAFPGRGDKRILLLSDGRATTRDPMDVAAALRNDHVKVFAVPAGALAGESLIADLIIPPAAWRSVPMPVEVQLLSADAQTAKLTFSVDGQIKERRDVQLPCGTSSIEFVATFEKDGVHRVDVKAEFPHDRLEWNNAASALVDVPLAPRVIIVSQPPAASTALASVLKAGGFTVAVVDPKDLSKQFSCDCFVLANVSAKSMTEPSLKAIERYVYEGGSILFTGGTSSFAAGGYVGSALEPAFPVLLIPKKEHPPYALALIMDNSWSMNEAMTSSIGKINIAKEIAIAAIEGLTKGDLITFVSFDSDFHNIIQPTKVADLEPLKYEVARIGAFGMTNILGGMLEGHRLLQTMDAPHKHLILITDGKETETGTDYSRLLALLDRDKVTLSTIGVGNTPNDKLLNTLAYAGKGRYYHAKTIAEIPAVVLQEARSLDDQLVVAIPLQPHKLAEDPALAGIEFDAMPKLDGYNRSRVRTHAWTPLVISSKNEPLLARMRYGRGQSLAFLSTAGFPWSKEWIESRKPQYIAFWRQAVISTLAPPHRALEARVEYDNDSNPLFDFSNTSAATDGGKFGLTRFSGGKQASSPVAVNSLPFAATDADALLLTSHGKTNGAFSWSRTYGREFAEPAGGVEKLKELCRATDGVFSPANDEPFVPGTASVATDIPPSTWLIVAAVSLVVEILLRRLPALTALMGGRRQTRSPEPNSVGPASRTVSGDASR